MTRQKPPSPNLDELDARIAEAEEHGNQKEADFARWQKRYVERRWAERQRKADTTLREK